MRATLTFSVITYLDLFLILFCAFSFFHFLKSLSSSCPLLDLLLYPFSLLKLESNGLNLFLFCGYLINFNLHTYQSLKLITILILLNNTRTLNSSHSFLLPIYMILCILITYIIPQNIVVIVVIIILVILYSQRLPTCWPLSFLFLTSFISILPSGITFLIESLLVANSVFVFWKFIYFVHLLESCCWI